MRFLLLQTVSPTIIQNTHYIYHLYIRAVGDDYQIVTEFYIVMIIQVICNGTCELYLLSYLLQLDKD